ncbi:MAG: hypothetical protein K1X86_13890 [Ignavibacteria bacterium]|nr:hypothetical protein [Ignavibacteria bacterium]
MTGIDCQNVLVFRTNVQNEFQRSYVQIIMNSIYGVHDATVDLDDVDKVLRLEIDEEEVNEAYVIEKMHTLGFMCKPLDN